MYTYNAAWMLQAEAWTGSIEPGKVADLIAFGPKFLEADPEELPGARVEMVVVGGEVKRRQF